MELPVKPMSTDVVLNVAYKEVMLSLVEREETRITLVRKFLEDFGLRLDDIKFNREALSGNFIHFVKSFGTALFDVSFGLEAASAQLWKVESENQALDLFGKLFHILDEIPLASVRIITNEQFSSEGDLSSYFEPFNVNVPNDFKALQTGGGRQYHLRIPDHNLTIYIILANSIIFDNGVFLSIDTQFTPYIYDFDRLKDLWKQYYDFILTALNIRVLIEE